jgi:hypothetical protein
MPWRDVSVDGEKVIAAFAADRFETLEELPRDEWPGH